MPSINLYLDKPSAKGECPIFLVYQDKGRKFKHYTKEKIPEKYWDKKKQKAKHIADAVEINDYLDRVKSKLKSIIRKVRTPDGRADFDLIKMAFQEKKQTINVLEFCEEYIEHIKLTQSKATVNKYRTLISNLLGYEKHNNIKLTFDKINEPFLNKFLDYLVEFHDNTQNTLEKKISNLKTILRYATKRKINTITSFIDFKVPTIQTEKVFLTQKELETIYHYDLSDNLRLEKIRDMFCFGCYTGLRYSDIKGLKYAEIVEKISSIGEEYQALQFRMKKTKNMAMIPLSQFALDILNKYEQQTNNALSILTEKERADLKRNHQVFPQISNQKMNDYIKEVGGIVGIDTDIVVTKYALNKKKEKVIPKYELLSTHAARRTFAIISLERGMRIEVLQKLLGHKSIKTTMKYVYILDEVKNQEMEKVWGDKSKTSNL